MATPAPSGAPLFSIITATFNVGAKIHIAAESVRRQKRTDVEYIIVDGGSTDDTLAHVESCRDVVSLVKSEPDQGIYDALNKGISLARGKWIGVLGADDRYVDGALDIVAEMTASGGYDIAAGSTRMIGPDGREEIRVDEAFGVGALVSGIPFGHNAMFAHRDAYRQVGPYDISYRICADANWVHRAIRRGMRCARTNEVLVEFPLNGTSSTDPERVLGESDRTIQENFPFLTAAEARQALYSVRGWAAWEELLPILERHGDLGFEQAVRAALKQRHANPVDCIGSNHHPDAHQASARRSWRRALSAFVTRLTVGGRAK
jgi:hypothetical protein